MAAEGSMAVWFTTEKGAVGEPSAEIHLNYWRVPKTSARTAQDFLEVGVLISEPDTVNQIYVYLPSAWGLGNITDCGPLFKDVDIANGIFNRPLRCTDGRMNYVDLSEGDEPFCRVHKFATNGNTISDDQLRLQPADGGTILSISSEALNSVRNQLPAKGRIYFRLRALIKSAPNPFLKVISPQDRLLQSGFEEIEYVDVRVNEPRTLPLSIEERMRSDGAGPKVRIEVLAFLAAVPVLSELIVSSLGTHKMRVLEDDIWPRYVGFELPRGMMVYHWKEVPKKGAESIEDFSVFIKLQTRRTGLSIVWQYLLLALVFGVCGNLIASCIDRNYIARPTPGSSEAQPPKSKPEDGAKEPQTAAPQ